MKNRLSPLFYKELWPIESMWSELKSEMSHSCIGPMAVGSYLDSYYALDKAIKAQLIGGDP